MKIALGSDHAGYQLKETIKLWLGENGYGIIDMGTHDESSCDYPDYGKAVGLAVASGEADRGIVVCGTGIGISLAANKVKGIRAALCSEAYSAQMSRLHNDANVLAMGQRVVGPGLALYIVEVWLGTEFEGGRHQARVDKLMAIESI